MNVNDLYPTTPEKVGVAVRILGNLAALVSAARAAKRGEYDKAIYRAVLWVGMSANSNAADAMRARAFLAGNPVTNNVSGLQQAPEIPFAGKNGEREGRLRVGF